MQDYADWHPSGAEYREPEPPKDPWLCGDVARSNLCQWLGHDCRRLLPGLLEELMPSFDRRFCFTTARAMHLVRELHRATYAEIAQMLDTYAVRPFRGHGPSWRVGAVEWAMHQARAFRPAAHDYGEVVARLVARKLDEDPASRPLLRIDELELSASVGFEVAKCPGLVRPRTDLSRVWDLKPPPEPKPAPDLLGIFDEDSDLLGLLDD